MCNQLHEFLLQLNEEELEVMALSAIASAMAWFTETTFLCRPSRVEYRTYVVPAFLEFGPYTCSVAFHDSNIDTGHFSGSGTSRGHVRVAFSSPTNSLSFACWVGSVRTVSHHLPTQSTDSVVDVREHFFECAFDLFWTASGLVFLLRTQGSTSLQRRHRKIPIQWRCIEHSFWLLHFCIE